MLICMTYVFFIFFLTFLFTNISETDRPCYSISGAGSIIIWHPHALWHTSLTSACSVTYVTHTHTHRTRRTRANAPQHSNTTTPKSLSNITTKTATAGPGDAGRNNEYTLTHWQGIVHCTTLSLRIITSSCFRDRNSRTSPCIIGAVRSQFPDPGHTQKKERKRRTAAREGVLPKRMWEEIRGISHTILRRYGAIFE